MPKGWWPLHPGAWSLRGSEPMLGGTSWTPQEVERVPLLPFPQGLPAQGSGPRGVLIDRHLKIQCRRGAQVFGVGEVLWVEKG